MTQRRRPVSIWAVFTVSVALGLWTGHSHGAPESSTTTSRSLEAFQGAIPIQGLELLSQRGGTSSAVAWAEDGLLLAGMGPRIVAWDVTDPRRPRFAGESAVLPGLVRDLAVAGNRVWAALAPGGVAVLAFELRPNAEGQVAQPSRYHLTGVTFLRLAGEISTIALHPDRRAVYVARRERGLVALQLDAADRLRAIGGPPRHDGILPAADVTIAGDELLLTGSAGSFLLPMDVPSALGRATARRIAPGAQAVAAQGDVILTGDVTGFMLWGRTEPDGSSRTPTGLGLRPPLMAGGTRGSPTVPTIELAADGTRAVAATGLYGTYVLDLRTPQQPAVLARLEVPGTLPGDARDTALHGDLVAVAGERAGIVLYDLETWDPLDTPEPDPGSGPTPPGRPDSRDEGPVPIARAERPPGIARHMNTYTTTGRLALVDGHGVDLLDLDAGGDLLWHGRVETPDEMNFVEWSGKDTLLGMTRIDRSGLVGGGHRPGLIRIDATDPTAPRVEAYEPREGHPYHLDLADDTMWLALGEAGVWAIPEAEYPPPPAPGAPLIPGSFTRIMRLQELLLLVRSSSGPGGIEIWRAEKGNPPERLFAGPSIERFFLPDVADGRLWIPGPSGLWLFDLGSPRSPKTLDLLDMPMAPISVEASGDHALVAADTAGLRAVTVNRTNELDEIGYAMVPGKALHVRRQGDLAILSARDGGLYVFRIPSAHGGEVATPDIPTPETDPTPPSSISPFPPPRETVTPLWLPRLEGSHR